MSDMTVFANNPVTTVAANGYNSGASTGDAPSPGTAETWTMSGSGAFPLASNAAVPPADFHIADPAAPSELILVRLMSGTSNNTWLLTRGDEGTTPVTHAAGATFYQVVSAGDLTSMKQATGALTSPVTVAGTVTETVVCSYQPVAGEIIAGTTFELLAAGSVQLTTVPTLQWRLRWGGVAGTQLLSMVTGTNCPALVSTLSAAGMFDINGTVTFVSTTSAVANLNFFWQHTTTTYTGVASSAVAVTGLTAPPGGGPLVLTAQWSVSSTQNSLVTPAPLAYRAA